MIQRITIADYDALSNLPIINTDLSIEGFAPVENTYYRHIGKSTRNFEQGKIYFYKNAFLPLGTLHVETKKFAADQDFRTFCLDNVVLSIRITTSGGPTYLIRSGWTGSTISPILFEGEYFDSNTKLKIYRLRYDGGVWTLSTYDFAISGGQSTDTEFTGEIEAAYLVID